MVEVSHSLNIAFASTNYGPMWSPVVSSWLQTIGYTSRYFTVNQIGKVGGAGVSDRMYTMTAQNKLIEELLAETESPYTHIFMTESDMVLPFDCIVKLLEMDKDMASGVYFLRSDNPQTRGQPCLYKRPTASQWKELIKKKEDYGHYPISLFPQKDPFQVDVSGLGCVLIKRRVFEGVKKPWFDLSAAESGTGYGSDMYFYTHAHDAGYELWCDPRVQPGQIDYYVTDIMDYHWQLENDDQFAKRGFLIGLKGKDPGVPV